MRAKFIYEKFEKNSDPIRDMGITAFPTGFEPLYVLIKQYPGIDLPLGTVFGKSQGWHALGALYFDERSKCFRIMHYTGWEITTYFEPFVGEFFERYK